MFGGAIFEVTEAKGGRKVKKHNLEAEENKIIVKFRYSEEATKIGPFLHVFF